MSSFDTVITRCNKCGTKCEFQSKAGACQLDVYEAWKTRIPISIAGDLDGQEETCSKCQASVSLQIAPEDARVKMTTLTYDENGEEFV